MKIKISRVLSIIVKFFIVLTFLYVVIKDIPFSKIEIPSFDLKQITILFLIIIAFIPHLLFLAFLWKYILKSIGEDIRLSDAWQISSIASLGRYLPGKIWLFVGKIAMCKNKGLGIKEVSTSLIFEIIGNVLGAIAVFIIFIISLDDLFNFEIKNEYVILLAICFLILLYPKVLFWIMNSFLKFFKKDIVISAITSKHVLFLILAFGVDWIYQGVLFSILVSLFGIDIQYNIFSLIFINSASWLGGFFSFLTPGGIGIREGIMIQLLSEIGILKQVSLQIAIVARIWMTLPEIIVGCIFILKGGFSFKNQKVSNISH